MESLSVVTGGMPAGSDIMQGAHLWGVLRGVYLLLLKASMPHHRLPCTDTRHATPRHAPPLHD